MSTRDDGSEDVREPAEPPTTGDGGHPRVAADGDDAGALRRGETPTERADRNWDELLQELRVIQTGLQILTGFLLTLPFQQRFLDLDPALRLVYLVALSLAVISIVLVLAPVAWHRILFRHHAKPALVTSGDRLTKAGLVTLALTIVAAVVLVFGFVAGMVAGVVAGALTLAAFAVQWFVFPRRLGERLATPRGAGHG